MREAGIAIRIVALWIGLAAAMSSPAQAQECPRENRDGPSAPSRVTTLEGQLVYHNDIRGWFELRLVEKRCGETSIQVFPKENHHDVAILRGCRVRSTGALDYSSTGYYTLDVFQDVDRISPAGSCKRQPPFPDYSGAKPDRRVRAYTVEMQIDYRPGDHPLNFRVWSAGREMKPWQAYASYMLTGSFVLYGNCAKGFVVDKVFGTPEAKPSHFTERGDPSDMASFDPEAAASKGRSDLHMGYTCVLG
jgi:hypothetical protein